jgi:hypothetical protein
MDGRLGQQRRHQDDVRRLRGLTSRRTEDGPGEEHPARLAAHVTVHAETVASMHDHGRVTSTPPQLRWARALLLAVVVLTAGSVAHASAHGLMPGPWAMATLLVLGTTAAAPLLTGPASTMRVVLLVVGGQTVVHAALTALAGHAGDVRSPVASPVLLTHAPRSGSLYDQLMPTAAPTRLTTPDWVLHLTNDLTGPHAAMAVAHLVAAAMVGLWLASGERALWSLIVLAINPALAEPTVIPATSRLELAATQVDVLPRSSWRRELPRRGPPLSFAV